MNSIRKWIRDVFGFSGNEINGFLILIPLMVALIFSEPLYRVFVTNAGRHYPEDYKKLDSLVAGWNIQTKPDIAPMVEASVFTFDPNTASEEELRRLGFSEISARRIAAYRHKGGVFRIKSDLMKIYGLDSTLYKQLYNYIRLPTRHSLPADRVKPHSGPKYAPLEVTRTFDINIADTILLKSVYGIGSRLALRIVRFRDGLGGFVEPEQLYEVYGLDSIVVQKLLKVGFIKTDFVPEKININTADEQQLFSHPYIRSKIARALVGYRYQHGDFKDISDIKKLSAIKPEELQRLLPYVKVRD
ncbi:MAG: helix-hairpin-helix domain-containing protein [Cyclobacteriaceae bacterium]